MRKTLTGILLATSVLAMATVQQVKAAETGATTTSTTSTVKEVHYATFKNGGPVDIKTALTGSAVTAASIENHPEIANYIYTSSREENGIMYHMYAPTATTGTTNSGTQTNPYHRDNNQNNGSTSNTNGNNNQNGTGTNNNSGSTTSNSSVKAVRFVEYKPGSDVPVDIKDPRTGSAASDTSRLDIANYTYVNGELKGDTLYHIYRSNSTTNTNQNNSNNQNQSTSAGQFKTENGKVYYIKDGKKVTGWQKIDGKTYYFEADGAMKKGLLTAGDKQYYLDEKDGFKQLGFVKVADKVYYFVENGDKKTGFIKIDDKTYYLKEGVRLTGDITVDGETLFLR